MSARNLRNQSTPEKDKVKDALRNKKFLNGKFKRQHVIQGFIVDLRLRLAIELDGKVHERLTEEERIKFKKLINEKVNKDINIFFKKIKEA